jgi:hypothetical protein
MKLVWTRTDTACAAYFATVAVVSAFSPEAALVLAGFALGATTP